MGASCRPEQKSDPADSVSRYAIILSAAIAPVPYVSSSNPPPGTEPTIAFVNGASTPDAVSGSE